MSHEELTDMSEFAEARALLGRALGEEPTMNFHPTSVLAAAKRSVSRGRAWAAGGIAAGVVVVGIGGAAIAAPFTSGADAPPAGVPTTNPPVTVSVSSTTVKPPVTGIPTTKPPVTGAPTTSLPPITGIPTTKPPVTGAPTTTKLPSTNDPQPTASAPHGTETVKPTATTHR